MASSQAVSWPATSLTPLARLRFAIAARQARIWAMMLSEGILLVGEAGDVAGVALIAIGIVAASARFLTALLARDPSGYQRYRADVGRTLLLGLEFLVAADVIRTVAVEPTFQSVGVLAIIVLIRTFMSWTLQLELEGRWPWQKSERIAADHPPL